MLKAGCVCVVLYASGHVVMAWGQTQAVLDPATVFMHRLHMSAHAVLQDPNQ